MRAAVRAVERAVERAAQAPRRGGREGRAPRMAMKNWATIRKRNRFVTRNITFAPSVRKSKPGPSAGLPSTTTENMEMKLTP